MLLPIPRILDGADLDLALAVEDADLDLIALVRGELVAPFVQHLVLTDVRVSPYALDEVLVRLSAIGGDVRPGSQGFVLAFGEPTDEAEEGDSEGDSEGEGDSDGEGDGEGTQTTVSPEMAQARDEMGRLTTDLRELQTRHASMGDEMGRLTDLLNEHAEARSTAESEATALRQENARLLGEHARLTAHNTELSEVIMHTSNKPIPDNKE